MLKKGNFQTKMSFKKKFALVLKITPIASIYVATFESKMGDKYLGRYEQKSTKVVHGSAKEGYYPHELILGYEVCQMKGTLIGVSELTLKKPYQFGLLRIQPLCFWSIR